jgi:outer membrane protein
MHPILVLSLAWFFFVALPASGVAQGMADLSTSPDKFLSLAEAIRTGLDRHPLLDRARYASLAAKALTKQTQGDLYPWLEASVAGSAGAMRIISADGKIVHDRGGHGFDAGGALPHHNQNMLTGGLLLNQLITDFGHTAHRILASQASQAATEKEILTNKALVILNVQKAYLNCLLQQRLIGVAEETLKRRKAVRDQIQALYKRQLKAKLDLDLILVEVSNAELALIEANNGLLERFAALNHAVGISGASRYQLENIPVDTSPAGDLDALVEEAFKQRPELLGGRDRLQASDELVKAVKALHFGSLSAVGSFGMTKYGDVHDNGIPPDGFPAPFWGAGATGRLPIFTGFQITNKVKEAEHHRGASEQELQHLANEVVLQVVRAYLTRTTNAQQIDLERDRVAYADDALNLAQQRYRLGLSPIIEVVRAAEALFAAQSRLAQAQYIYKTSEAALAYATGQDYQRF